jgi:hypothetical protein
MPNERVFNFNVEDEVGRYFDDSSIPHSEPSRLMILMGGPACGKTTLRKQFYSTGYVLVDAAEIFLSLSRGDFFPFPETFEEPMQIIGSLVAQRAISQRRHIITELIGANYEQNKGFFDVMDAIGYRVDLYAITCDIEEAQRRNLTRGDNNISCYYAEPYQRAWLYAAATETLNAGKPDS